MHAARVGFDSVRANAVPMAALWCLSLLTVTLYYVFPSVRDLFEPLIRWQHEYGWRAAFANRLVFTGILPGVFLLTIRSIRPARPLLTLTLQVLWCGLWGIACDRMYALVDVLFGPGRDRLAHLHIWGRGGPHGNAARH